jgi:hypothetical protein
MKNRQQIPRYSAIDNDMNLFNDKTRIIFSLCNGRDTEDASAVVMVVVAWVSGAHSIRQPSRDISQSKLGTHGPT